MPELLLELLSEEIPARLQDKAEKNLMQLVGDGLRAAGLNFSSQMSFSGPRRVGLVISDLSTLSQAVCEERKGPRLDAPPSAIAGFLKSTGLKLEQLQIQEDKKGAFYLASLERAGHAASDIIANLVPDIIAKFPWSKSMRWGNGNLRWIRPLKSILCLFDGALVPFNIAHLNSGTQTYGHRFIAPEAFSVENFADYRSKLYKASVIIEASQRVKIIHQEAQEKAEKNALSLVEDDTLLRETAGLTEWPHVLMGSFSPDFLSLPREIIQTTIKTHQKCFVLCNKKTQELEPHYLLVANIVPDDEGKMIIAGNDRVIAARLSDARFFWDQDRKTNLSDLLPKLDNISFHSKLGSQRARIKRLEELSVDIAEKIGADKEKTRVAARLAKADLVSGLVGEFPELQGLMGFYYAMEQGLDTEIATAIGEHYRPQGPSDTIPSSLIGQTVALADKLDLLKSFWSIDEKPTGSKDPFALRRACLGVIRIILEGNLRLPLLFEQSDLLSFFADRLKIYMRERGVRHDLIDAVFSLPHQNDLLLVVKRVEALRAGLETEEGQNLLSVVKRAANILKIEEKKDGCYYHGDVDPMLLIQGEERELHSAVNGATALARKAVRGEDFSAAMKSIARLRAPIDAFFDKVTVNSDDPSFRENRLRLLNRIREATLEVADFLKIEG